MADKKQLAILRRGVEAWNRWRKGHPLVDIDLDDAILDGAILDRAILDRAILMGASLVGASLDRANLDRAVLDGAILDRAILDRVILDRASLMGASLVGASLVGASLNVASFGHAILDGAILDRASLDHASLVGTRLVGARLVGVSLYRASLVGVSLDRANLDRAILDGTIFVDIDLSGCTGLKTCGHFGPSVIDHRTLQRSGPLPLAFLRGVGLPENLIDYLPSLLNQAIQMYSCFISYSSKDEAFAQRLHADLQDKGVRCWFAPHDLPIGAKTWDAIDEAIRLRDKLLLILSEHSIASDWVEDEVTKAFAEERRRGQLVLFPVRLDDAVLTTNKAWAGKLRDNRNIGDFRRWKEHDAYQQALDRLLRDLRVEKA